MLVFKGKAEVIEELDQPLRSATGAFPWPHVIRLVHYVRVPRALQRKISRRALFARDGWRCMYCGTSSGRLTLDHVVPRSRGGDSVWENVVTSCAPCNMRKGDRLPHEIEMPLRKPPRAPAPVLFIHLATPKIPNGWQPYLRARRLDVCRDRLISLDGEPELLPLAPRAGVEPALAAAQEQAVERDAGGDARAAVAHELARR